MLKSQLQNSGWMSGNPTLSPFSGWNEVHGGSMDRKSRSEMGRSVEADRRSLVLQLALKTFLFSLALAIVLPVFAVAEPAVPNIADTPKIAVETAVNGVIHVLKSRQNKKIITPKNREAIRQAVSDYFDFREMAKRSLGRPWRKMDEAQRAEFVGIFRELLERSYGDRLAGYHNQTIKYGKVRIRGRVAIVDSEVIDAEKRTPVRYRLVHRKTGWKVYDIKVEGISMVSTFRSDFGQAVSQNGINGFLADLKKKVEKMQKRDQS